MTYVKPLPKIPLRRASVRQSAPPQNPWMTPAEAACALCISKPTLYKMARAGYIPGARQRQGMDWVFVRTEIEAQAAGIDIPAFVAADAALVERIKRLEDKLEDIGRRLASG